MKNNDKGFTLIELIVILALASIVMLAVMSFFITNYKSYNRLNTESELQYQSQYIINFMTDKILEAEEYNGETDDDKYKFTDIYNKEMTFMKSPEGKLVFEKEDNPDEVTVGASIKELIIEPNPSVSTGEEVLITLTLFKDKIEVTATQIVYLRNSQQ